MQTSQPLTYISWKCIGMFNSIVLNINLFIKRGWLPINTNTR